MDRLASRELGVGARGQYSQTTWLCLSSMVENIKSIFYACPQIVICDHGVEARVSERVRRVGIPLGGFDHVPQAFQSSGKQQPVGEMIIDDEKNHRCVHSRFENALSCCENC